MMKYSLLFIAVAALFISSCKKETVFVEDCSGAAKSFLTDVTPIVQTSCATSTGCHASGSSQGPGALTNYAQVFAAKSDIKKTVANGTMPQNSSLTGAQKSAIICWINSGAPNN